jgi:hypothetical protein
MNVRIFEYQLRDLKIYESVVLGRTAEDVGNEYNLTRERIRQIVQKTVREIIERRIIDKQALSPGYKKLSSMRAQKDFWMDALGKYKLMLHAIEIQKKVLDNPV